MMPGTQDDNALVGNQVPDDVIADDPVAYLLRCVMSVGITYASAHAWLPDQEINPFEQLPRDAFRCRFVVTGNEFA